LGNIFLPGILTSTDSQFFLYLNILDASWLSAILLRLETHCRAVYRFRLKEKISMIVKRLLTWVYLGTLGLSLPALVFARPRNHPDQFNRAPLKKIEARQAAASARSGETGMANVSERRDVEVLLMNWGAFPVEWLKEQAMIGSVRTLPREAQIQLAFACSGIRQAKPEHLVLIEGDESYFREAQKLKEYLVVQQGISPERIKIVYRDTEESPAWEGWLHVRPQNVEVPVAPTPELLAWSQQIVDVKNYVKSNSAGNREEPIRVSQAVAIRAAVEQQAKDARPSYLRDGRIRTLVSTEYLSLDGLKGEDSLTRAAWMGFRVGGDLAVLHAPVFELGFSGNVARSFIPMSVDAQNATATSWVGESYGIIRANSTLFGIPELRVSFGWMGNNRSASSVLNSAAFLPAITGPRARLELSSRVDGIFRLALHGGGVSALEGYQVLDFGGSLSQRLWDNGYQSISARVGLDAGIARAPESAASLQTDRETWASFQVGIAASL
jgi:hypothetical protein